MGPPVQLKDNVLEFINKWKDDKNVIKKPYEKNGRFYVEIKREYREIKDFLNYKIEKLSIGKNLIKIVNQNYYVIDLKELLTENLKIFWTKYLDKRNSWEW
jgi:tRNA nucleotidyltransferase (CCA-adding enzyme)